MSESLIPSNNIAPLIPEATTAVRGTNEAYVNSLVRKAALADEQLGVRYQDALSKHTSLGSSNTPQLVRGSVADTEKLVQETANIEQVNQSVKEMTTTQVAETLNSIAFQEAKQDAVERQYVERLASVKDEKWLSLADENTDIFQRKKEETIFLHKLNAIREEFVRREGEENIFEETVDFVKEISVIPMLLDFFNPIEGSLPTQVEDLKRLSGVIKELPEDQQSDALSAFAQRIEDSPLLDNPQDMVDMIDRMSMEESDVELESAMIAIEFLSIAKTMSWIGRAGSKTFKGTKEFKPSVDVNEDSLDLGDTFKAQLKTKAKVSGKPHIRLKTARGVTDDIDMETLTAREIAGEQAVADDLIRKEQKLSSKDQFLNQTSMLTSPASAYGHSLSPFIQKAVNRNSEELSNIVKNFTAPERLAVVARKGIEEFEQNHIGRGVLGASVDDVTGNITYRFGTKGETPFATKATAQKAIDDLGLTSLKQVNSATPVSTPHGWVVKVDSNSPDALTAWKELGFVGKNIKNMEDVVPALISMTRQAEDAESAIVQAMEGVIDRDLRKFFGKKGAPLRNVISEMQSIKVKIEDPISGKVLDKPAPKWLTTDQFAVKFRQMNERYPTNDEAKAYIAFRQLNDFGAELKLKVLMDEAVGRGDKMYQVQSPDFASDYPMLGNKINPNAILAEKTNNKAIMVMGSNPRYFARGKMQESNIQSLDDFDIINVSPSHREDFLHMGRAEAPVEYIALPKGTKSREMVPTDLSNYLAGGRTADASPFFIKSGKIVNDSAGDSFRLNDKTLFSASSAKQAKEGAKQLNELTTLMKAHKDDLSRLTDDLVAKIGLGKVGINTVQEADSFMKRNSFYNNDYKIEGIGDRELVDIGDDIPKSRGAKGALSNNSRSQIFGERTGGVQNILGNDSTRLDPLAATVHSLNVTSEYASTTALRERSLAYFAREFRDSVDTESNNPYDMLVANVRRNVPQGKKNAIQAHQKFLTNMLGFVSDDEAAWKNFVDGSMNWAFNQKDEFFGKGGLDAAALQKSLEKRENAINLFGKDPFTKVRALTFHTTLGMLSLPSFIMQAINVTNIMAVAPKHGSIAAAQALPIRMALLAKDGKVTDFIATHAKKIGFDSPEEFKMMINEIKVSGLDNIGTNHSLIAGLNGMAFHGSKRRRAGQFSKVFFDQGELLNRITARATAHRIWKEANPSKAVDSPEGRAWIGNKTHTLTLGMSRADNQLALRNNIASIPTQFWSFPMRLTAAMMPKMMGGSAAFSSIEKGRLAAANVLLWGGAGIPLLNTVTDKIAQDSEMSPEAAKMITNGLFDTSIYVLSGGKIDSNMSDRVGNAEFYTQLWDSITGDKEAIEVMGGAAGGRGTQILGALTEPLRLLKAGMYTDPNSLTDTGLRMVAGFSSGANNWFKLHLALKHGMIYSRSGKALAGINVPEAFASALGIPPQSYARMGENFDKRTNRLDLIKEYETLYLRALQASDTANTSQEKEFALDAIRNIGILAADEGDGIQADALRRALSGSIGTSMTDRQINDYYRQELSGHKVNQNMAREADRQKKLKEKEE